MRPARARRSLARGPAPGIRSVRIEAASGSAFGGCVAEGGALGGSGYHAGMKLVGRAGAVDAALVRWMAVGCSAEGWGCTRSSADPRKLCWAQ